MVMKIRLRKQGRTHRPSYRMVVTDSRARRDGQYVETIGWYNPVETEETRLLKVDSKRALHWLETGAQPTEKVSALLRKAAPNVMQKHTEKVLAHREKTRVKRKERKAKKSAA